MKLSILLNRDNTVFIDTSTSSDARRGLCIRLTQQQPEGKGTEKNAFHGLTYHNCYNRLDHERL